MIIFVMRHGEAEPYKQDDTSRRLTGFGVTQVEHAAKWMKAALNDLSLEPCLDLALVSPYVRTQETIASVLEFMSASKVVETAAITPMQSPESVQDLIDGYLLADTQLKSLLLVSHMPLVSLLSDLLSHGFNAKIFDTADVLMIDYDVHSSCGKQIKFYQSLT
jgi:phosphohistidine phosphatase